MDLLKAQTTKPWSFMLRMTFCPMTASPYRAMSATGSDMLRLLLLLLEVPFGLAALKQMPTATTRREKKRLKC